MGFSSTFVTKSVTFGKILDLSGTVSTNSKMKAWVIGKLRFLLVIKISLGFYNICLESAKIAAGLF